MKKISGNSENDFIADDLQRPLDLVYRDEHYVAAYKPAGLMVHRGSRTQASEPAMLQALRDQLGQYLYPIHRLDRPTAGVVLFGFTRQAAAHMGELFEQRKIVKHYQALVHGFLDGECTVNYPLTDRSDELPDTCNDAETTSLNEVVGTKVQTAVTHVCGIRQYEVAWMECAFPTSQFSLLEVQPITGRWHQIRRHLKILGHPILGDYLHGDVMLNQCFFKRTGISRMLLTAMRLDFRHPYTDEQVSILVPRGESFERALKTLDR